MKSIVAGLILVGLMFHSCSSSDYNYDNPNLLNPEVRFEVNLSLPQFNDLQFPNNPVYINGYGNGGVVVLNTGSESYVAFDAADPNHPFEDCSVLKIEGLEGVCQCEDHNTYDLFSGTAVEEKSEGKDFEYTLKPYRVVDNGNGVLTIKN